MRCVLWWVIGLSACGSVAKDDPDAPPADAPIDAPLVDAPPVDVCAGQGLVACYRMEPVSPPTLLADGSGKGNDGTLSGVSFEAGMDGMAIRLGASSRVAVPDTATLDVDDVTLDLWIEPASVIAAGQRQGLLDNNKQYGLFLSQANTVTCAIATTDVGPSVTTTVAVNVSVWTHVACTYSSALGTATIYLNGTAVSSLAGSGTVVTTSTDGTIIGGNSPCAAAPCTDTFNGALDSVRVWQRALTAAEVCTAAGKTGC